MTTYYINERNLGGDTTKADARRLAELLANRGYNLAYGDGDKSIGGIADLLTAHGCDPTAIIEIAPGEPLTRGARI